MEICHRLSEEFGTTEGPVGSFVDLEGMTHVIYSCDFAELGLNKLVFEEDLAFEGKHFPPATVADFMPSIKSTDDDLPI